MHDDYENGVFFKPSPTPDHHYFALSRYVETRVRRAGVGSVETLRVDTYGDATRWFSFRRSTHRVEGVYGRQISAVVITPS